MRRTGLARDEIERVLHYLNENHCEPPLSLNEVGSNRTLQAVFAKSKVRGAQAHRFRHTLATEILIAGGTIEDCANILGDSPEIIRKHYAKWSPEYQRRTVDLMTRVHGTYTAREDFSTVTNSDKKSYLVLEEGVEPSYPVKDAGF